MRWLSGGFAALFTLAAVLQANDPDPLVWILGYLAAAILSLAAAFGRTWGVANGLAALVFSLWFASLAPSLVGAPGQAFTSFEMQAESHEEPREAIGLALCAGWTGLLAWRAWARRRESAAAAGSGGD